MPVDWLPGWERYPVEGCTGPGTYIGAPWRLVLHTTESRAGSMGVLKTFFRDRPCSTPHFALDPATGERVQFIRLPWSAAALAHPAGTVETNRANCVQIELVGFAAESHTWPDHYLERVGAFIADVIRAGVPLNLNNVPRFYGQGDGLIATANAKQRMAPSVWLGFDGVCGHQHVPGNDHWDPGRLNIARVIEHARAALGDAPDPDPVPAPLVEDDMYRPVVLKADNGSRWLWDGGSAPVPASDSQIGTAANLHNAGQALQVIDVPLAFVAEMRPPVTVASTDPAAIAAELAVLLGPSLARQVADELGRRLDG